MKVLFCTRPNYLSNLGGDTVQLLNSVKFLRSLGVDVTINSGEIKDYSTYDIIHLFNLTRISETYEYFKTARRSTRPIVITPVYWDLSKYFNYTKSKNHIELWKKYEPFRNEILNGCSMIYPSSLIEKDLLQKNYGTHIPSTVVFNCVDSFLSDTPRGEKEYSDEKGFILCVARICPRKNQFALARACNELGEKLILAGEAYNKEYLQKCLIFKNVMYTGFVLGKKLMQLYRTAKLHTLCSFVETPGLSNLEAAACGCNIISTSEGSTAEYFKDMALYCNPYDYSDICNTIRSGLTHNKQPFLQEHILKNFNMEKCLLPLYQSYLKLI